MKASSQIVENKIFREKKIVKELNESKILWGW